jgi:hypothetical protein
MLTRMRHLSFGVIPCLPAGRLADYHLHRCAKNFLMCLQQNT